tara:strand:+ start:2777 stop:3445 length:669 start_codon:yes stop_codon:yes gene_type:complete
MANRISVRSSNNSVRHTGTNGDFITTGITFDPTTSDWSASIWMRVLSRGNAVLMSQADGTGTGRDILTISSDTLKSQLGGSVQSFGYINDRRWHSFILVHVKASNRLDLYVDSVKQTTLTLTPEAANGAWVIGARPSGAVSLAGQSTHFHFWDKRLDLTERKAIYFDSAVPRDNLLNELLYTEGSGTNIADTSGNGDDATITDLTWASNDLPSSGVDRTAVS